MRNEKKVMERDNIRRKIRDKIKINLKFIFSITDFKLKLIRIKTNFKIFK